MNEREVTRERCAQLRRAAKGGTGLADIADAARLDYGVVARHVRGNCDHDDAEPPAPME